MDQGTTISTNEIKMTSVFLRKTPVVYTCRNVIQHHLFSNGIVFSHRRGQIKPDPHMQEIMTDFWLPFCRNMVDSILSAGIVVVRIVELQGGLRVPVVLDQGCCQLKMKYTLGIREYICLDSQNEEIPNSMVLDSFGFSPTIEGKLTSVVANILPQIQYMNILRGTSIVMEQKRSDPVVMTETVDTKADHVEGVNYDYYADGDMQDQTNQNKFMRNKSSIQELAQQQQLYDNFFADGNMTSRGSTTLENVVTLPLGHKIVNQPQQTGRGDLCAQMKAHDDIICAVIGIPRSLVMSDTPHKTDAEGTHQTFQKTIMYWKNSVQSACEQVYNVIYADKIKEQMMKVIGKKRKKTGVEDVYALKKRMQVEITFPISPFIGPEQLYTHYQRGVVSWETYQQHACAAAVLPHEPLPEPRQLDKTATNEGKGKGKETKEPKEPKQKTEETEETTNTEE